MSSIRINVADLSDMPALLMLMRCYCDHSDEPHVPKPTNEQLRRLCETILIDRERKGLYVLARSTDDRPLGFASIFWSWSLVNHPGRRALLSDLYVHPDARGQGVAGLLLQACRDQAVQRGDIRSMTWQTAIENQAAQHVYARFGVQSVPCADYELPLEHTHCDG
jgi:GNAT superfamily N-acetyltransferase